MSDYYSPYVKSPSGCSYRLHISVTVAEQNVAANTTTFNWMTEIQKDRSYAGFYWFSASWNTVIAGYTVLSGSGVGTAGKPDAPWTGWSTWVLGKGQYTVANAADGTLASVSVAGVYVGLNETWAPGTLQISGAAFTSTPAIPRATTPKVTPSPCVIGGTVTISLPAAVGTYVHDITWSSGSLSGTIATGVSGNQTWTVPDVSGEFSGVVVFPIAINVVTKTSGGTTLGSKQVTLFAKEAPAAPSIVPLNSSNQYDVRARLVTWDADDSSWEARTMVPADQIQLVDSASATATLTLALSKLNAVDFSDYSIVDVDVFNGEDWVFTNHRFVLSRVQGDDIDVTKTVTYSGTEFVDYELGYNFVQADENWDGATGHAAPTTPGAMMAALFGNAHARGWGPRINYSFTATQTSLGEPWANTAVSRTVSAGTSVSQFLAGLVSDGLVEYRTEYHDDGAWLILLNPGTGQDFSAAGSTPVVNLALAKLSSAPRQSDMSTQVTAVTVSGDVPKGKTANAQVTRVAAPFDANVFGRMESWVTASGVTATAALNSIGDNALADNSGPTNQRTFAINVQDMTAQYFPYCTFDNADWILIPDNTNPGDTMRDRINQITVNKTVDAFNVTIVTGELILAGTALIAKRQAAQTGGAIGGGNQSSPSQLDSRIPAAPTVDTITSAGYWSADGEPLSAVTITWDEVTEALDGSNIGVSLYEVWERIDGIGASYALAGTTGDTTINIGGYDPLAILDFRIRAQSDAGVYGEFSEDQTETMLAPSVSLPDAPDMSDLYTDGVGNIFAVWGGTMGGVAPPAYLAYVLAEISSDGGTTYTPIGTPIAAAGTIVINPNAYGDYFIRLRGYDRLGNAGTAGDATEIVTVDPNINPPIPTPPTDVTATAGADWDASGILPTAWFDLTWTAPTEDLDGNPIDIAGYDLFGLKDSETIERYLTSSTTEAVRYSVGNGETWTFRVSATSTNGGVSGESEAITATADVVIDSAPAPDAPVLDQYAGILQIQWAGGGLLPQIKYVYASISPDDTIYTRVGMILSGAGEIDIPGLAPGDYYAKITMVDEMGNISTSTASDPLTLLPITGVTYQTSELPNTGIKITTGSFTAYDDSGNPTFILDASTGEVWIAPYAAVFDLGAPGSVASTGAPTTGLEISAEDSSFNTFIHPSGVQIRHNETPLSWWEADASDASLVNFFSPRAVIGTRLKIGDYEQLVEAKTTGTRLVTRYKGA